MSAIAFLLIALLLSGIGSAVLVLRNRRPTSVESGIDDFRREMNALAPPDPVSTPPRRATWNDDADGRADGTGEAVDSPPSRTDVSDTDSMDGAGADDGSAPSPADPRPRRSDANSGLSPDEPGAP